MRVPALAAFAVASLIAAGAHAQIAVSANDNKAALDNGATVTVRNPQPDTIAVIDLGARPPRLVAEIEGRASVVGPPLSVAIAPSESFALVSSAMKVDPADPSKLVPDNVVSLVDLRADPPRITGTLEAGASPAGLSINRQGTLALVANRAECSVSIYTITPTLIAPAGKVSLGPANCGASHVAISPDGRTALVTRDGDHKISVLAIDGAKVEYTKRDMNPGLRPYGLDICMPGNIAVVANIGVGAGDADTVSVIDMTAKPVRIIDTISVGQTPEGIICSPDGSLVAVTVMSGSNKPKESPFYRENGRVVVFRVDGKRLAKVGEADVGNWSQGAVFSRDGRTLLVQNMVQKNLQVLEVGADGVRDTGQRIPLKAGPAGIRVAERP